MNGLRMKWKDMRYIQKAVTMRNGYTTMNTKINNLKSHENKADEWKHAALAILNNNNNSII